MGYLLGVDLGTSGTKTALFDEEGNAIRRSAPGISALSARNRVGRTGSRGLVAGGAGNHRRGGA
jgi:N-acetylglucosamine kinase-like BadF-type ATPase